MSILWVTSFARDMWKATGERMVNSFLNSGSDGRLLVCTEGDIALPQHPRLLQFDLDQSRFLKEWLSANRAYIPVEMGGTSPGCRCVPGVLLPSKSKRHKPGCPGQWFNRNASRWFRKVVSLREALTREADTIVWVDCDCAFSKRVAEAEVGRWFRGASIFYFRSTRPIAETGIVGYRGSPGREAIECLIGLYASQEYRRHPRWDDSAMFERVLQLKPGVAAVDVADKVGHNAEVVPYSPVGPFIQHFKGHHGRKAKVMR